MNDRCAARALLRSPGFAVVAALTLALGIGAATAISSVVNGVLLRPLPYAEPSAVMQLWQVGDQKQWMPWSAPNFLDVREQSRSFAALAAYTPTRATMSSGLGTTRAEGALVSDGFFRVLGVEPAVGRAFSAEEVRQSARAAVVP